MRAPTGVRHNIDARAGIGRKEQVQHDTGLQAGTRTTTNTARITDTGERAGTHKIQVWSRGQVRSTKRTKGGMQADRGVQGVKTRRRPKRHRVPARTTPSITTHEGCHDTKRRLITHGRLYRVGFETLHSL
jgi:hypothetical protein